MSFKVFQKYDKNWSTKPSKDRAIKFKLKTPLLHNQKCITEYINEKSNLVSQLIWNDLQNGSISSIDISDGRFFSDKLQKKYRSILNTQSSAWEAGIIRPVVERYKSYIERNKKLPNKIIKFRNDKSTRIHLNIFKLKKGHLQFKLPEAKKSYLKIDYDVCGTMDKNIPYLLKGLGGNLVDKKLYVARSKIPITWKYQPTQPLGLDINERSDVFAVLSNGTIFTHSQELEVIISEMKQLNNEIGNKNKSGLTSKQRQRRRLRLQKLHVKQEKLIYKLYINNILDLAEKNKMLVCIDHAKTGSKRGSYGQDKLISLLTKECENRSIPHVLVPPKNSSKLCHICNAEVKRDPIEIADCPNCGQLDADFNGAMNIARFGDKIWNDGIKEFYTWRNALV